MTVRTSTGCDSTAGCRRPESPFRDRFVDSRGPSGTGLRRCSRRSSAHTNWSCSMSVVSARSRKQRIAASCPGPPSAPPGLFIGTPSRGRSRTDWTSTRSTSSKRVSSTAPVVGALGRRGQGALSGRGADSRPHSIAFTLVPAEVSALQVDGRCGLVCPRFGPEAMAE